MKQLTLTLLLMPIAAWAGPFDGTWVGDVATATVEGKPDTYLLQNGEFTCSACGSRGEDSRGRQEPHSNGPQLLR